MHHNVINASRARDAPRLLNWMLNMLIPRCRWPRWRDDRWRW